MVPSDLLGDAGYLYMEGVKIHEYYHNINGSQVSQSARRSDPPALACGALHLTAAD
jgi:hypothetical protein